jgi:hypothetical protein
MAELGADAALIGAQSSNYTGNAGLGGGYDDSFKIDTRPLEQLGHYAWMYNKAEFEDQKRKTEGAIKELADATAYDLSSAIPKDRNTIQQKYSEFQTWVRDNAHDISENNLDKLLEFRRKKNEFDNVIKNAKARDITYKARMTEYSNSDPLVAGIRKKQLEEEANNTSIDTQLSPSQKYELAPVDVKPASTFSVDVIRKGDNQIVKRDYTIPSFKSARDQAVAIISGLEDRFPKEGTPEFQALTEGQKNTVREARLLQGASGRLQPIKEAEAVNAVLNKTDAAGKRIYFNDDGTLNVDKLSKGESGNALFMRVMQQVDAYNNEANRLRSAINDGDFQDKAGNKLSFGFGVDDDDYQGIDLSKGSVTPEELLTMKIVGKTQEVSYKTTVQETNEGINKDKVRVDFMQAAETGRHNRATESQARAALKLNEAQLGQRKAEFDAKNSASGNDKSIAFQKAERIYNSLAKLADANGVISPDKIRQLNQEQLKYLGSEVVVDDGMGHVKSLYKPLEVDDKNVIQLVNGEVRVMSGVDQAKTQNGRYYGNWDNTKSSNLTNIATNVLNEQLKTAGSKELGAYSGTEPNTPAVDQLSTSDADWTQEGDLWRYKDGSLWDANGKKVK